MAFQSGDRARIVEQLNLHKDQAKVGSTLAQLMTDAETFDAENSTTYVADIRLLLAECETLETTIDTEAADDGIKRVEVFQAFDVEYSPGGASQNSKNKITAKRQKIKDLLDPDGRYLDRYTLNGRVIRTL